MSEAAAKGGASSSMSSGNDDSKKRPPNASNAAPSNTDDNREHSQLRPPQQQQQQQQQYSSKYMKWGGGRAGTPDDESNHYLSEPSVSEEGGSTTDDHHGDQSLLDDYDEDDEDDEDTTDVDTDPPPPPAGPPPPMVRNSLSSAGHSPGNTSLSSWESHFRPHNPNQHVRIHFSPEPSSDRNHYNSNNNNSHFQNNSPYYQYQAQHLFPPQNNNELHQTQTAITSQQQQLQQQSGEDVSESARQLQQSINTNTGNPFPAGSAHTHTMSYSTFSVSTMSTLSTKEKQHLDNHNFIHNLRQHSEGALQESSQAEGNNFSNSLLNTSLDDSTASQPAASNEAAVWRTSSGTSTKETPPPARATHRRISSVETELIGNISDAHAEEDADADADAEDANHTTPDHRHKQRNYSMDESPLVLNFSVLGDYEEDESRGGMALGSNGGGSSERTSSGNDQAMPSTSSFNQQEPSPASGSGKNDNEIDGNTPDASSPLRTESSHTIVSSTDEDDHHLADSDQHQHSADDEQTQFRPPRRRIFNAPGKPSQVHRRTRSGDSAAAALTTGGKDWIGMFKDKIPLPDVVDDDEEEDEQQKSGSPDKDKGTEADQNGPKARNGNAPGRKKHQVNANNNNNNEKVVFALGAAEGATASRAAARKQRREQRQQHRSLAEKAAAVATQQRIQRQYNEWAQSPMWNVSAQGQLQHNRPARADSSESNSNSNSLGSIPSSIGRTLKIDVDAFANRRSNSTPEIRVEEEAAPRRHSLDTVSSGLSLPSEPGNDQGISRRESTDSRKTQFSWISTSNHDTTGSDRRLPTSPHTSNHSINVHPNWSPQSAALASPILYHRQQEQQQRNLHHQRSQTAISGYPSQARQPRHSWSQPQEHQDSFQRLLYQQQEQAPGHDSFRLNNTFLPTPHDSAVEASDNRLQCTSSSGTNSHSSSGSGTTTSSSYSDEEDDVMGVMQNVCHQMHPGMEVESLEEAERYAEAELLKRGSVQHVLRGHHRLSPFANFGRKVAEVGARKFDRASFLPKTSVIQDNGGNEAEYPTYRCPRCNTIQREFFSVNNAPRQYETASGFLALSFVVYVIASLYIFGLEEGWPALDCIYFAVITLTTAGLGDFVPTTDFNKVVCSVFIYFGVACIGLLLGSYIASMLDETSRRRARENRINACPNCARLQNIKDAAERRLDNAGRRNFAALSASLHGAHDIHTQHAMAREANSIPLKKQSSERMSFSQPGYPFSFDPAQNDAAVDDMFHPGHKKIKRQHHHGLAATQSAHAASQGATAYPGSLSGNKVREVDDIALADEERKWPPPPPPLSEPGAGVSPSSQSPVTPRNNNKKTTSPRDMLGSPMTKQILGRQSHTRHASFDINGITSTDQNMFSRPLNSTNSANSRMFSFESPSVLQTPTISENVPFVPGTSESIPRKDYGGVRFEGEESSYSLSLDESSILSADSFSTEESDDEYSASKERLRTAKYVFLTLKEALVNSMVIIAVGCLGFWFIEGFSLVDSWYFTTVLLTTVGYGDIVPVTKGGKLFATIYILVAGTILLNNMSLISMIPLELRKRRIERAVLTQFGDLLDDDALRELASGPLIQRLKLSGTRSDGLDECTREMFALAMLVRLGKVTEDDIHGTFEAFNKLDVNGDGVLNSRSIIAGMIHKSRNKANPLGMKRVPSLSSMTKTPPPSMYGSQGSHLRTTPPLRASNVPNGFAPTGGFSPNIHTMSNPITIPHRVEASNERSSLLGDDRAARNMLSRSG